MSDSDQLAERLYALWRMYEMIHGTTLGPRRMPARWELLNTDQQSQWRAVANGLCDSESHLGLFTQSSHS